LALLPVLLPPCCLEQMLPVLLSRLLLLMLVEWVI
jgi:hypothetical protein